MNLKWIEDRTTSVIRRAELLSENGAYDEADAALQTAIDLFETQAGRLREAQTENTKRKLEDPEA